MAFRRLGSFHKFYSYLENLSLYQLTLFEADKPLKIIFFVNRNSILREDFAVTNYPNISLFKFLLLFLAVLSPETTIFLLLGLNSATRGLEEGRRLAIALLRKQLFRVAPQSILSVSSVAWEY